MKHHNSLRVLLQKHGSHKISNEVYNNLNFYDIVPFLEYNPEKWKAMNIAPDKEYSTIAKHLASGESELEKHFISFSGRWFPSRSGMDRDTRNKVRQSIEELIGEFE